MKKGNLMTYSTDLIQAILSDPTRLALLESITLLDTAPEVMFDRLTCLAAQTLNAPIALITLVDADRQFFKSQIGLPAPWNHMRETPLSHSFCKHVVITNEPVIIPDARLDSEFCDHMAIGELNIVAYLGLPMTTADGIVLGSFCVIDHVPRSWTAHDVEVVRGLAATALSLMDLRFQLIGLHHTAEEKLLDAHDHLTHVRAQNASMRAVWRGIIDDLERRAKNGATKKDLTMHIHALPHNLIA